MALAEITPTPLTWNSRAECELKGPERPPVPLRVSRMRVGSSATKVEPLDISVK